MAWATCPLRRWDPFVGISWHEAILPGVPPITQPYYFHLDCGMMSGFTQLFGIWSEGRRRDTFCGDGQVHMLGRLSDAFPLVPHVSFPPTPPLFWTIVFGSSNAVWGTGGVVINGYNPIFKSEPCDAATALGFIPTIHLSCGEPLSFLLDVGFATTCTVQVGMTLGDFITCLIDIAIQVIFEALLKCLMWTGGAAYRKLKFRGKLSGVDDFATEVADAKGLMQSADAFDSSVGYVGGKDKAQLQDRLDDQVVDALRARLDDESKATLDELCNGDMVDAARVDALTDKIHEASDAAYGSQAYQLADTYEARIQQALDDAARCRDELAKMDQSADDYGHHDLITDQRNALVDELNKAIYTADYTQRKLDSFGDDFFTAFKQQHLSMAESDELMAKIDDAGTWDGWYKMHYWDPKYGKSALEGPWNLYASIKASALFLRAMCASSDNWFVRTIGATFMRRISRYTFRIAYRPIAAALLRDYDSDESEGYYGNRQDLIDSLNPDAELYPSTLAEYAELMGHRFGFVDDDDVPREHTSDRTQLASELADALHLQWADEDFDIHDDDRFGWVGEVATADEAELEEMFGDDILAEHKDDADAGATLIGGAAEEPAPGGADAPA